MLFRTLVLKSSGLPAVQQVVKSSTLFKPLVERFIAGEGIAEAVSIAESLAAQGYQVSLDRLGENVASRDEATVEKEGYKDLASKLSASPYCEHTNISIKLTALGLDQGDDVAEANFRELLSHCATRSMFVRADMEGSPYTERTVAMVERVFPDLPNTGTVLQSYLHRTDDDLDRLLRLGCRIRLVKGAYLEPATVAYQDKAQVDAQYLQQAKKLLKRGFYPALATHDAEIIEEMEGFVRSESIDPNSFEWQMLYGIRRDLQAELKQKGYRVRVYVPFGHTWYPYFTRRLAERPANLLFIARAMVGR